MTSIEDEPQLIKAFSVNSDVLVKEGVNSGKETTMVLESGSQLQQVCGNGTEIFVGFLTKANRNNGGVMVLDAETLQIKQRISTLAIRSCAVDNNYLVASGNRNSIVYIYKRGVTDEYEMVSRKTVHGSTIVFGAETPSTVYGTAVNTEMDSVVTVANDKCCILSDLAGEVKSRINLPGEGDSVVISPESGCAYVGCEGHIVIINIADGTITSSFKSHNGCNIFALGLSPQGNLLMSGGLDKRIIAWQITPPTLTEVWSLTCASTIASLCLDTDRAYVNVTNNNTVAVDLSIGQIVQEYSKCGLSQGVVINHGSPIPHFKFAD